VGLWRRSADEQKLRVFVAFLPGWKKKKKRERKKKKEEKRPAGKKENAMRRRFVEVQVRSSRPHT